jgi:hypothetical protein
MQILACLSVIGSQDQLLEQLSSESDSRAAAQADISAALATCEALRLRLSTVEKDNEIRVLAHVHDTRLSQYKILEQLHPIFMHNCGLWARSLNP